MTDTPEPITSTSLPSLEVLRQIAERPRLAESICRKIAADSPDDPDWDYSHLLGGSFNGPHLTDAEVAYLHSLERRP